MKIKLFDTNQDACKEASLLIADLVRSNPKAVLGLATGRTPLKLYEHLINEYTLGLSFKTVTTFNLDEYHPLAEDHPDSYRTYMNTHFFKHVDINLANTFFPKVLKQEDCTTISSILLKPYDALIASKGGIDLQILGIGNNGHIGFNEPSLVFNRFTHLTELAEETLSTNRHLVKGKMPTHAITMGIQSIFNAKKIILIASGQKKGAILKKALENPITPEIPASILTLHPNAYLFLDTQAFQALEKQSTD